jgi:hypothetical protein
VARIKKVSGLLKTGIKKLNDSGLEVKMPERSLLTVPQLAKKHPAFKEGGIRSYIFNAKKNGFEMALVKIGRKILIDESKFFEWIDQQQK